LFSYSGACDLGTVQTSLLIGGQSLDCTLGVGDRETCQWKYTHISPDEKHDFYTGSLTNNSEGIPYEFVKAFQGVLANEGAFQCGPAVNFCNLFKFSGFMITDVCICQDVFKFIETNGFGQIFIYLITLNPNCSCPENRYFQILNPDKISLDDYLQFDILNEQLCK
uniref:Uncharacterized protein n=1 Tax=Panagrolaimus sp. JU765 TaxID=591449 RepID=A0AC34RA48_9BILA